jgi:hypothetical protein
MIDLHYIDDLNLISARLHDLDLDVERLGADLERIVGDGEGARGARLSIERALAKLVVHDWPRPYDPVVRQLRAAALALVGRLEGDACCG